jgi:hypothetical protein
MVALRGIHGVKPLGTSKIDVDCSVTTRDRINDHACDSVQWDVIYTETPFEVEDVTDVFLMQFRGQQCLEEPTAVMNLRDVPKFLQFRYLITHNWSFTRAVVDAFDGDGCGIASVDDTFVVLDGDEKANSIEDTPILLDESFEFGILLSSQQRGGLKLGTELLPVEFLVVLNIEPGIKIVEITGWMLPTTKDRSAFYIMKEGIELVGSVRKTTVVIKNIWTALAFLSMCGTDG